MPRRCEKALPDRAPYAARDSARRLVACACLPLLACLLLTACSIQFSDAPPTPSPAASPTQSHSDAESHLLSEIYERASPSVVNIEARNANDAGNPEVARRGSGFVYDQQGHIITNAHLVKDADSITVTLSNALVLEARLLGADSFSDVAVLKTTADAEGLQPLRIGESASVRVGQRAIAIGNPFGLNSSMTTGIVSGVGRALPSAELMDAGAWGYDNPAIIQIDALIYPGSSGGPLLDGRGLVIGMTTAMQGASEGYAGIGFAVPADTMRRVIPELLATGRVDYAWMGISVMREEGGYGVAGLSATLSLPTERGVLLRSVAKGSPAHQAGLRGGDRLVDVRGKSVCAGGDLIVAINDYYFDDLDALMTYLVQQTRPGDEVALLIIRDRRTLEVTLRLANRSLDTGATIECGSSQNKETAED